MSKLKLNQSALDFAKKLIEFGQRNKDENNWMANEPTPESEDVFLSKNTFDNYSNWFLAINEDTLQDTKERYEFPIGNFYEIFRSGVLAAEKRAGQYGHKDIENAAKELVDLIDRS